MRRGRENLFEELGRVEGERSNKNRRAEVSRIHGELNKGYKAGGRATRFRSSGPEGKPHSTKEGRSAEAQRAYMRKHGPQKPRRKTLAVTDKYKEAREKLKDHGGFKPLRASKAKGGKAGTGPTPGERIKARKARAEEWWTGKEGMQAVYSPTLDKKLREKRPHSSPEGRMRDVKAAHAKAAEKEKSARIRRKLRPVIGGRRAASTKKFTPKGPQHRTSKAVGGAAKKITKRFLDFIKTGKHVDKHGVKVNVPKAAERLTGKPHVDHGKRKRIKHLGKGKAKGGPVRPIHIPWPKKRVKKGHGGSAQSHYLQHGYGPTKVKLRSGKPKLAKKGW